MCALSEFEMRVRHCAILSIALSPANMRLAGEELGHPPSREEAIEYFINFGGRDKFNAIWENVRTKFAKRLSVS